jgi:hypothetical protein
MITLGLIDFQQLVSITFSIARAAVKIILSIRVTTPIVPQIYCHPIMTDSKSIVVRNSFALLSELLIA